METLLATLESEISLATLESTYQDAIDDAWNAGNRETAAADYVREYFRKCDSAAPVILEVRASIDPDAGDALDVIFSVPETRHPVNCFTVWFEPCISRVYGEW